MIYIIGIGLSDEKDITVKSLEAIKRCKRIYLEDYTSLMQVSHAALEKFYGKKLILADRAMVESKSDEILHDADKEDVALLVVGDAMGATTHIDFILRAKEKNIPFTIIHNTSILNAIGVTGLQLYKFGKTTSIVFSEKNWLPETPYDVIKMNKANGLHTLCLLDIKKDADRYMTVNQGIETLLEIEAKRKEKVFTKETFCVGCARIGSSTQIIKAGKAKDLLKIDFGKAPHCLIVPGEMHFMEEDALKKLY